MAETSKGNGPTAKTEDELAQALNNTFQKEVWAIWAKHQQAEKHLAPDVFYRTLALSLMHMSAVVAVDVHITDIQFMGMAKTLWDDVYAKAPRFS